MFKLSLFLTFVVSLSLQCKQTIDDFSQLNSTQITAYLTPSSYEEIGAHLHYAQNNHYAISVMGSRHSQGGHTFSENGIVIHLKNLNNILNFDPEQNTITVQTGITWKEVQDFLNAHNRAVKIMQFANLFTVGGSLSVNANGIDPHCGPFIESVRSIKIMLADGNIVTANRDENAELFRLAIGGYGLFGIILEATLDIVENILYKRESRTCSLDEYIEFVQTIPDNTSLGFHFAHIRFNTLGKKLFKDVLSMQFTQVDEPSLSKRKIKKCKRLYQERFVDSRKWEIYCLRESSFIRSIQWMEETFKNGITISRNNIMRPPASHLFCKSKTKTQLLQEYFIPVENLKTFVDALEEITMALDFNLLHVAFRYIPANTESILSYARTNCIGVVVLFSQKMKAEDSNKTAEWTQYLIDTAIDCDGTYYLPIQLHADSLQIRDAYPHLDEFFSLKKKYDPSELFVNHFYNKYVL
jgi:FAD/FMN-containing dehydrogenase